MRADRLMNIMILLQNNGKMTSRELAESLEVTDRTISRDMEALSALGIPVMSERGKEGGWRLLDNFRSRLSGMKLDEIKSLFISPPAEHLKDLGIHINETLDTRNKLLAALPSSYQQEAQKLWERVYIDSSTWRQSKEKAESFQFVQMALFQNRRLSILYESTDGTSRSRVISPLGLVAQSNKWYLIALRDGEIRNYRVSRILSAELMEESFEWPEQFNLAEYWRNSKKDFIKSLPVFKVDVEIEAAAYRRISFSGKFVQFRADQVLNQDTWVPATLTFQSEKEAVEFILGFANKIKIIQPAQLTGKVIAQAKAALDFHRI
ncbi:helix-turn-helix transcriptional regulator [Peribacillus sp. SCS-155]|uniref:helix-turn-helix transcriptional regulator n=1 Tax=Peribacillus sedimenti TaxID=3115297 RepID=UPI0039066568